jgi:phosphatidate cytidylyltransferase
MLGVAWIGLGLVYLLALRDIPERGRLAAFTVLLAVWAGDTFAFFAGRLIGRHKLAPKISPGKTWEGLVAGTLATVFVTFVALYDTRHEWMSVGQALLLGLAIAAAAPLGDLFESLVKRDMGVKDSGHLLAGHGGILDRVDAQLFAAIAGFYVILAFDKV